VQQLQEQLAQRGTSQSRFHHISEEDYSSTTEEETNPFHRAYNRVTSEHEAFSHRQGRRSNDSHRGFDIKVDITEYEGQTQLDEFLDWLNTIERVFEFKEVPEHRKVKLVAIKLKKHASIWWEQLKIRRAHMGNPKIISWEKMKSSRKSSYQRNLQDTYLKLHNFKQNDLSIEGYIEELDHLMLR